MHALLPVQDRSWSTPSARLRGRDHYEFAVPDTHFVNGRPIKPPFPRRAASRSSSALGCFWGAEEIFWQSRACGRPRSATPAASPPHPDYEEVCSGLTGHTEAVLVVFDPSRSTFAALVATFFEVHDPTQGMRQGNDVGTQYRSGIYYTDDEQRAVAERAKKLFGEHAGRARLRRDHHRGRAARRVLLRRGLPPAVPGQEPERLPLPQHDRSHLPAREALTHA